MPQPIPDGYHSVTPSFTFKDCHKAIEFYQRAFAAKVLDLLPRPGGQGVMHATIRIGNSILMMGDEMPGSDGCPKSAETIGNSPISLYLYVADVDAAFQQALAAGAQVIMPVIDMFWGDRCGVLKDPFGHSWMIGTHKQDLTPAQIEQGALAFFEQMAQQQQQQ